MSDSDLVKEEPLCSNCASLEVENSKMDKLLQEYRINLGEYEEAIKGLLMEKHRCQEAVRDLCDGLRGLEALLEATIDAIQKGQ